MLAYCVVLVHGAQVDLKPVFEQKDGNVYKWLRACIDLRLGVEDVRTAMRNLHSALTGNKKVQHAADVTAAAAAMTTVGKDNVGPLVELARHHNAPKGTFPVADRRAGYSDGRR